jgi:hypothetical protein
MDSVGGEPVLVAGSQAIPIEQQDPPWVTFGGCADDLRRGWNDTAVRRDEREDALRSEDRQSGIDLLRRDFAVRAERQHDEVRQVGTARLEYFQSLAHLPADHAVGLKAVTDERWEGVREHRVADG